MPLEVHTPDNLQYQFHPVSGGCFNFKVRAPNDAHIALTSAPIEQDPMFEIFIGGWSNSKSVIRKNRSKPDVVEVETPGILNPGEFRGFWIRWFGNVITVGREGEAAAFMAWEDPQLIPINFAGVCTGWGANGTWIIDECHQPSAPTGWAPPPPGRGPGTWVPSRGGAVPPEALEGGRDLNGEQLYIARARHNGALIPGKLVPSHGVCYVPWAGGEHPHDEYEVLCGASGIWVPVTGNNLPPNALPAGESETGEPLFVGRANHEGTVTIGKVQPSHGCCYIPFGGQELAYSNYEVFLPN